MDLTSSWAYIEEIAAARLRNDITRHHVADYGTEIETIGAAGEVAARRFLGLDEKIHEHFDGGADLIYKGFRVDVKATCWTPLLQHRFLQWPQWKTIRCDFVLMSVIDTMTRKAKIVGFATKSEIERAPVNFTRSYPCHEIAIPLLHRMVDLMLAREVTQKIAE